MSQRLNIHDSDLLLMESEPSRENILKGFWEWVALMDKGNFEQAVAAIYWGEESPMEVEKFKEHITTFFSRDGQAMEVVYPCEPLREMIEEVTEIVWEDFYAATENHVGWCMLKIPVTNDKAEAKKSTNAALWAVAASFFIRLVDGKYVFEFEIFQL